ncbi:MAG: PDZ domain-containing protein, partial [Chloroflexi bacterium]|nr:PDZ domain-containing protein [Chloroflexota bacterium]
AIQAANVRSGPGLDFEVIGLIDDNTQAIVVKGRAEDSNWLQIEHNGKLGWLAGDLIAQQYLLNTLPTVNIEDLAPETEVIISSQPDTSNIYVGIGARLGTRNGLPAIEAPFIGSPADQAGLQPGDIILAIDGQNVTHLSVGDIVNRLRGEIGVAVTLAVSRSEANQRLDIVVVRDEINLLTARDVCVASPVRGFGTLWDNQPEVRELLGCAFTNFRRDEHATRAAVQTFEHGWMLWLETDTVANVDPIYVFFEDEGS